MILNEYLKDNNLKMSRELADILVLVIKDMFPTYYEGCTYDHWDNFKIANYAANLDLDEEDVVKLLQHASRLSKIWIFS